MLNDQNQVKILENIQLALQHNQYYLEAYKQLILFYFNTQNEMECRKAISVFAEKVKEMENNHPEDLAETDVTLFKAIVRIMIEGEIWEEGAYLMEIATGFNKLDLEAGYLHAFCLFNATKDDEAYEICEDLQERGILNCGDKELLMGYKELMGALEEALANKEPEDEDWQDDIDDEC